VTATNSQNRAADCPETIFPVRSTTAEHGPNFCSGFDLRFWLVPGAWHGLRPGARPSSGAARWNVKSTWPICRSGTSGRCCGRGRPRSGSVVYATVLSANPAKSGQIRLYSLKTPHVFGLMLRFPLSQFRFLLPFVPKTRKSAPKINFLLARKFHTPARRVRARGLQRRTLSPIGRVPPTWRFDVNSRSV